MSLELKNQNKALNPNEKYYGLVNCNYYLVFSSSFVYLLLDLFYLRFIFCTSFFVSPLIFWKNSTPNLINRSDTQTVWIGKVIGRNQEVDEACIK